ncbi:hypothetical protein AAMO2058_001427200 [Amorphochlora amoebiformis]
MAASLPPSLWESSSTAVALRILILLSFIPAAFTSVKPARFLTARPLVKARRADAAPYLRGIARWGSGSLSTRCFAETETENVDEAEVRSSSEAKKPKPNPISQAKERVDEFKGRVGDRLTRGKEAVTGRIARGKKAVTDRVNRGRRSLKSGRDRVVSTWNTIIPKIAETREMISEAVSSPWATPFGVCVAMTSLGLWGAAGGGSGGGGPPALLTSVDLEGAGGAATGGMGTGHENREDDTDSDVNEEGKGFEESSGPVIYETDQATATMNHPEAGPTTPPILESTDPSEPIVDAPPKEPVMAAEPAGAARARGEAGDLETGLVTVAGGTAGDARETEETGVTGVTGITGELEEESAVSVDDMDSNQGLVFGELVDAGGRAVGYVRLSGLSEVAVRELASLESGESPLKKDVSQVQQVRDAVTDLSQEVAVLSEIVRSLRTSLENPPSPSSEVSGPPISKSSESADIQRGLGSYIDTEKIKGVLDELGTHTANGALAVGEGLRGLAKKAREAVSGANALLSRLSGPKDDWEAAARSGGSQ